MTAWLGMDPGQDRGRIERCIRNLVDVFRESIDLLEKQHWYPGDPLSPIWWGGLGDPLEIIVTAILVKLSRWRSALDSLESMRKSGLLDLRRLSSANPEDLARVIRGVGFPRSKARTIVEIARYIERSGGLGAISRRGAEEIRRELMDIDGIGRETADSILLFALNKPVFPAARLSMRVLERFCGSGVEGYESMRRAVEETLGWDLYSLKLLHAGLTTIASKYCRRSMPKCGQCPLVGLCIYGGRSRSSL